MRSPRGRGTAGTGRLLEADTASSGRPPPGPACTSSRAGRVQPGRTPHSRSPRPTPPRIPRWGNRPEGRRVSAGRTRPHCRERPAGRAPRPSANRPLRPPPSVRALRGRPPSARPRPRARCTPRRRSPGESRTYLPSSPSSPFPRRFLRPPANRKADRHREKCRLLSSSDRGESTPSTPGGGPGVPVHHPECRSVLRLVRLHCGPDRADRRNLQGHHQRDRGPHGLEAGACHAFIALGIVAGGWYLVALLPLPTRPLPDSGVMPGRSTRGRISCNLWIAKQNLFGIPLAAARRRGVLE